MIFSSVEHEDGVGIGRCAAPAGSILLLCDSAGASWLFAGGGGGGGGRMGSLAHCCLLTTFAFDSKKRLRIIAALFSSILTQFLWCHIQNVISKSTQKILDPLSKH